jgi:hypothetical protein
LVLLFHEDIMKIYFIAGAIITIPLALGFHPLAGLENYDSRDLTGVWKGSSSNKRYEVSMFFKKAGGYEQYLYYSNGATSADEKNSCVWSGFGNSDNSQLRQCAGEHILSTAEIFAAGDDSSGCRIRENKYYAPSALNP